MVVGSGLRLGADRAAHRGLHTKEAMVMPLPYWMRISILGYVAYSVVVMIIASLLIAVAVKRQERRDRDKDERHLKVVK